MKYLTKKDKFIKCQKCEGENNFKESKDEIISENVWEKIEVDKLDEELIPFLMTIPLQKLAFYSALEKGYDIDKPRNLAKSVTVE